jgi:hypothetical protein
MLRPSTLAASSVVTLVAWLMSSTGVQAACGPAWAPVAIPTPTGATGAVLKAVASTSQTDAWAVGYADRTVHQPLIEHWNGSAWSVVPAPSFASGGELLGVTAISTSDAWAVGDVTAKTSSGLHGLALHWDGSIWKRIAVATVNPGGEQLTAVTALSSSAVYAVGWWWNPNGNYGPQADQLLETWNGTSWTAHADDFGGEEWTSATNVGGVISGGGTWGRPNAEGAIGGIWDGSQWTDYGGLPDPESTDRFEGDAITGLSSSNLWVIGSFLDPNTGNDRPLFEHWDGSNWTYVATSDPTAASNDLYGATAAPTGQLWAVGSGLQNAPSGFSQPFSEFWDGSQWVRDPVPPVISGENTTLSGAAPNGAGSVWAVGGNSYTTDQPLVLRICPVEMTDTSLSPGKSTIGQGSSAVWNVPTSAFWDHILTDTTFGQYDADLNPGQSLSYQFTGAGTYAFSDNFGEGTIRRGTIKVPMTSSATQGPLSTTVTITWASIGAPSGFVYDVQIKKPGATSFTPWQTGTTARLHTFKPTVKGTYQFEARVRESPGTSASGWSPALSIKIT